MKERCCLLVVDAHPDDETIQEGGTLARYAASGVRVVCVTATRGELGEIVDPALSNEENQQRLGEIRMREMADALAVLGPVEARWLGYRDSGMAGDPTTRDAEAFCRADPEEAAGRVARIIRELRPQVVITHGDEGEQAHPDHRQAAIVTLLAVERCGDPDAWPEQLTGPDALEPWTPSKVYRANGQTRAQLAPRAKLGHLVRRRGLTGTLPLLARAVARRVPGRRPPPDPAPARAPRPPTTARIDVAPWVGARQAAIRAFRTQVDPEDPLLELPPELMAQLSPTEDFVLQGAAPGPVLEDDLFAGIRCDPSPTARNGV